MIDEKTWHKIDKDIMLPLGQTLSDKEIKAYIDYSAEYIISQGLTPAVRTIARLAKLGNADDCPIDTAKLSLDASKHITGMAGLSGTTPSTVINAIIQINRQQVPEAISKIFAQLAHNESGAGSLIPQAGAGEEPVDV